MKVKITTIDGLGFHSEFVGDFDYETNTIINLKNVYITRKSGKTHWFSYGIPKYLIKERIDING